jgi:hypothetical protein
MTIRGNWILRTNASLLTTERTAPTVASPKKVNSTIEASSCAPSYCSDGPSPTPTLATFVKKTYSTANSSSGRTSCHR